MRTYVVALIAVACLGLSACGSDDATQDVVPSTVPELTPPPGSAALAQTSTDASDTQSDTGTTSTDQSDTTSTDQTQTQGQSSAGGTATQPAQTQPPAQSGTGGTSTGATGGTQSGGTSTGGTGGVSPGEFSQFCKDNPGAC
jgi:cytoskeletal protein RodZ